MADDTIDAEAIEFDSDDPKELAAAKWELAERCRQAGIKYEELDAAEWGAAARVHIPSGRDTHAIPLFGLDSIRALLLIPFEKFVLLGPYAAVCSYEDGTIEAGVGGRALGSPTVALQRLRGQRIDHQAEPEPLTLDGGTGGRISLGPSTNVLEALGGPRVSARRLSLRITGFRVRTHDQALEILERLANSLFFQIDTTRNVAFSLTRRRPVRPFLKNPRSIPADLEFPRSEYDRDPISLYWYARSAVGMPLLQYLAFYQTVEYYFPTYSEAEARRKVRNVLKNPSFRADRDIDLARILLAARASARGYGDERAQLRATLNECLEPGDLREFLNAVPDRATFFSSRPEGLTDRKISIRKDNADLRNEVADRIYDIRCRIVHTKAVDRDGDVELLLPYSREAELLFHDVDLIQYVARAVLISASTPIAFSS